eukprot:scaffold16189_cov125-Cylindrotheca_fusiformis.AAC.14
MSLGADKSLCLKLGYVAMRTPLHTDEIVLICECILQLYKCSPEYRTRSFRTIGASELFPLLVQVWRSCLSMLEESHNVQASLRPVVQIFRVYARLDLAKPFLIHYDQGKWLGQIIRIIELYLKGLSNLVCLDIVTELTGLIKDVSFRSAESEKEALLFLEGGALRRILFSSCEKSFVLTPKMSEMITAIIWNFVLEKSIRNTLLYQEGRENYSIVDYLADLLIENVEDVEGKQSTTILKLKRNAISAIGNILLDPGNHILVSQSDKVARSHTILQVLFALVEKDSDSIVRRRAMRSIRCLATGGSPQTLVLLGRADIISFLVITIARNISQDDENDRDTQMQAFQTASAMTTEMRDTDWPRLETALHQRIETTTDPKLILGACRCLADCVVKSPWRRGSSCFSDMFWKRLETTASTCEQAHNSIAKLIHELAKLEGRQNVSRQREPSCLTCTSVVKTIATLVSAPGGEREASRNEALEAVLILAGSDVNKRPLAESEDLLSGLVNLCLLQPGIGNKEEAKKLILELVPEL